MTKQTSQKLWQTAEWAHEARQLSKAIKKIPSRSKIITVLRHSHREDIVNVEQMTGLGLTNQGKAVARAFGTSLPPERKLRLYHSIVPRCQETAESILEGFIEIGGQGKVIGPLKPLYFIEGKRSFILGQLLRSNDGDFINRWAAGHYPPEKFQALSAYSYDAAREIWGRLEKMSEGGIDIHVTHDLHLMGLRMGWFALSPCNYWVSYLGGFALVHNSRKMKLYANNRVIKMKHPHWWRKK